MANEPPLSPLPLCLHPNPSLSVLGTCRISVTYYWISVCLRGLQRGVYSVLLSYNPLDSIMVYGTEASTLGLPCHYAQAL